MQKNQKKQNLIFESGGDGERLLIAGKTGSGKSWHAQKIIAYQSAIPFIILDLKDDKEKIAKRFFDLGERVVLTNDETKVFELIKSYGVVIYTPSDSFNDDEFNYFITDFYNRVRFCGICFDEAMLLPNCNGLKLLMTRGRSKGLSVISCTQRPVEVPTVCRSEAGIIYTHALKLPKDVLTMSELTGINKESIRNLKGYEYLMSED